MPAPTLHGREKVSSLSRPSPAQGWIRYPVESHLQLVRDPKETVLPCHRHGHHRAQAGRGRASRERGKISHVTESTDGCHLTSGILKESITWSGRGWRARYRLEYSEDFSAAGSPPSPGDKNASGCSRGTVKGAAPYDCGYRSRQIRACVLVVARGTVIKTAAGWSGRCRRGHGCH